MLRPVAVRAAVPIGIFAAFVATAWLTGYNAYSYDPASRGLQRITICLLVFVLASNGLRTRRAMEIIIGAIVIAWLLNSLWTIFHYDVMLKGMRQILRDNPRIMEKYFGISVPTPELKHRIESNRAFGTFLFPNALGAFLVLGLPVLIASLPGAFDALRSALGKASAGKSKNAGWHAVGLAIGVGTATLSILYFGNEFIGLARPDLEAPIAGVYRPFLIFMPAAIVLGGGTAWLVKTRGALVFGRMCMGIAVPAGLLACVISLWLSYSRGAAVSLLATGLFAAFLVNAQQFSWAARFTRSAAATLLLVAALFVGAEGRAQNEVSFEIPDPLPAGIQYEHNRYLVVTKEMQTLDIEGSARNVGNLADMTSLRLRSTYWQVGMKMFADNLWTGVGLGNFKTAYPKYQFLGAGDVETAHNDFLNYFCETGIFGGALFLAFWVYFSVWGARRILQEQNASTRRWLAAFYAGTLAFTVHTLVDFDFQNPSLSMLAFAFAGIFFAWAYMDSPQPVPVAAGSIVKRRLGAVGLGIVVVACTSSVLRGYFFELGLTEGNRLARLYYVGDRKPMEARLRSAKTLWDELSGEKKVQPGQKPAPRYMWLMEALTIVPDMAELSAVGEFRVPVPEQPGVLRPLKPGERPPGNTYLFFRIADLPRAREFAAKGCEQRIEVLSSWDESYPHDPTLSAHIFSWYEILFTYATDPAAKRRYAMAAESWARKTLDRSPQVSWWHTDYAKALWLRASIEPVLQERLEYYRAGLEYYKKAHELYPRKAIIASQYGDAQYKFGEALVKVGSVDEGQRLMAEGMAMLERAVVLDRYDSLVP